MHTKAKNTKKKLFLKEKIGQQWGRNKRTTYTHAHAQTYTQTYRGKVQSQGEINL